RRFGVKLVCNDDVCQLTWNLMIKSKNIARPAAQPKLSGGAHSPPCEGGVALPLRKCREASEAAETGWSLTHHVSKRISKRFGVSDHPGALRHPPFARRGMSYPKTSSKKQERTSLVT